jgi:hypothetical protein
MMPLLVVFYYSGRIILQQYGNSVNHFVDYLVQRWYNSRHIGIVVIHMIKRITKEAYVEILSPMERKGLHEGRVLHRLHRHYCEPMGARGHCTRDCSQCKSNLKRILAAAQLEEARDPYALLVWAAREAVAIEDEKLEQARARTPKDWLGRPTSPNPFVVLLDEMR